MYLLSYYLREVSDFILSGLGHVGNCSALPLAVGIFWGFCLTQLDRGHAGCHRMLSTHPES